MFTSVKFPTAIQHGRDAEGYPVDITANWSDSYSATARDATNTESVKANQSGYDIERIFEVHCYAGAGYLVDDADGQWYDVKRAYTPRGSRATLLECTRREPGRVNVDG